MTVVQVLVRSTRAFNVARLLCLGLMASLFWSPGCTKQGVSRETGTSDKGERSRPGLDARGGESNSNVFLNRRTPTEGDGGVGGSIRMTTSGGNITLSDGALVSVAQAPSLIGGGLDVVPGQKRTLGGAFTVNWLRVQAGGTLHLLEDTLFVVLGDVVIDGRVDGRGDEHSIDGRDFTIDADGIINITGSIDCSGFSMHPDDVAPTQRNDFAGGNGGELYISSDETTTVSPGPHIFIGGTIQADGGDTFSQSAATARPGRGGQILIGSDGQIAMDGRISAHGGKCYFSSGLEGDGGSIELVAVSNIEIGGVKELNANGGDSSGAAAGNGGTVLIEAPVGTIDFDNFDVECRGGRTTFTDDGEGGTGGSATFTGATVLLTNMTINVTGGDAVGEGSGIGGDGGAAQIAGSTAITVASDVVIIADGGETHLAATTGSDGGEVKIVNLDESDATALDFDGSVTVSGGKDAVRSTGHDGEICVAGSNTASNINLVGTNNFPISNCTSDDVDTLVVHDLDCDELTITPDEVATSLPAIVGVDFYRVLKTTQMAADGLTTVTVTVTGEDSGNIDLFTGPAAALGSDNPASYTQSSTGADSEESLDVDISGLAAGGFFSVRVKEQFTFVEDYTISVSCE